MLPVAGKPIVQRLVEDLVKATDQKVAEIVFIIRKDFGEAIPEQLLAIAKSVGSAGHIRYQDVPLGTAHAILCAGDFLEGNVIVAFADTLFRSDFKIDAIRIETYLQVKTNLSSTLRSNVKPLLSR